MATLGKRRISAPSALGKRDNIIKRIHRNLVEQRIERGGSRPARLSLMASFIYPMLVILLKATEIVLAAPTKRSHPSRVRRSATHETIDDARV